MDNIVLKLDMLSFNLQKKRVSAKIEKGTGGMNDVDISWLPQETLNIMSRFSSIPNCFK